MGGRWVGEAVRWIGSEGVLVQWAPTDRPEDWRKPIETSQHVPHSPEQEKNTSSQSVHTTEGTTQYQNKRKNRTLVWFFGGG